MRQEQLILKVLVVDDNRPLVEIIQEVLEDDGLKVMSAKDGEEGYSTYLFFRPDVVVTDIQMPRKNGLEMMEHIRTHQPMIRTIYMSGDIDPYRPLLREEELRYPVSYFEKPFSLDSLKKAILALTTRSLH